MMESTIRNHSDIAFQIFLEGARELLGVEQLSGFASGDRDCAPSYENRAGMLLQNLEETFGTSAGNGLALRIGRAMFRHGLKQLGAQAGFRTVNFRMLPCDRRVESGIYLLARTVTEQTGCAVEVRDEGQYWSWRFEHCPFCAERQASNPCCYLMVGLIQEFAGWAGGGRFYRVVEAACQAAGAEACVFHIQKTPLDCG